VISDRTPQSLEELAEITGRAKSSLVHLYWKGVRVCGGRSSRGSRKFCGMDMRWEMNCRQSGRVCTRGVSRFFFRSPLRIPPTFELSFKGHRI
jgi:hypothetical protein